MSRASCWECERSGWNIDAMTIRNYSLRWPKKKTKSNMLRNSSCRVTEALISKPSLWISLRLRGPFMCRKIILLGDWQADLEYHASDIQVFCLEFHPSFLYLWNTFRLSPKRDPAGTTEKYAFLSALIFHQIYKNPWSFFSILFYRLLLELKRVGTSPSHCSKQEKWGTGLKFLILLYADHRHIRPAARRHAVSLNSPAANHSFHLPPDLWSRFC